VNGVTKPLYANSALTLVVVACCEPKICRFSTIITVETVAANLNSDNSSYSPSKSARMLYFTQMYVKPGNGANFESRLLNCYRCGFCPPGSLLADKIYSGNTLMV
jgi:hypothetical protein